MDSSAGANAVAGSSQEYVVRAPNKVDKKFNVMKFNASLNVDLTKWSQVKMERENNLRDFKADVDMPKFGAGSEYGRDAREEARKKKYGIVSKRYKADDQPWVLRLGSGKTGKRFRGIREGGVTENASYFVFTQAQDGAFEAFPVNEWYNYTPVQTYKTLNDDEAEEEFGRRDKVFNYFNIMLKKRLKKDEMGGSDGGRGVGGSGAGSSNVDADEMKGNNWDVKLNKRKGHGELKISDADDWINSSEDEDDDDDELADKEGDDDNLKNKSAKKANQKNKSKNQGKKKLVNKKKKKGSEDDDDDEAWEDSDDGDGEGREVDYISDGTSSDSDGVGADEDITNKNKDELKGVEDEEAIRKMENSDTDDDDEDAIKKDTANGVVNKDGAVAKSGSSTAGANTLKEAKKEASSSESSADSSDSDDFDNDTTFQSAMFMPDKQKGSSSKKSQKKANKASREAAAAAAAAAAIATTSSAPAASTTSGFGSMTVPLNSRSRPNTPTIQVEKTGLKRSADVDSKESVVLAKKPRTDPSMSSSPFSSDLGISEESIRRYLVRKPMTARELLQKFKSKKTGLSSDQMVNTITQILKRLNPDKQHVKGKMYLSIKPKSQ